MAVKIFPFDEQYWCDMQIEPKEPLTEVGEWYNGPLFVGGFTGHLYRRSKYAMGDVFS